MFLFLIKHLIANFIAISSIAIFLRDPLILSRIVLFVVVWSLYRFQLAPLNIVEKQVCFGTSNFSHSKYNDGTPEFLL